MKSAFQDPGFGLGGFTNRVWVSCPQCESAALATTSRLGEARLVCASCGFLSTDSRSMRLAAGVGVQGRHFSHPIQCDNCGRPQPIVARRGVRNGRKLTASIRCRGCGYVGSYPLQPMPLFAREGVDPWFGLPLFLSVPMGSETLWVFNAAHLALLEDYVGAAIRKRPAGPINMTMLARLPRWMKLKSGRDRALRAIARLRRRALKAGIS
jgi:predicted RNA-binding Zn-ribbon protein involved in translation (DUF1610 family)